MYFFVKFTIGIILFDGFVSSIQTKSKLYLHDLYSTCLKIMWKIFRSFNISSALVFLSLLVSSTRVHDLAKIVYWNTPGGYPIKQNVSKILGTAANCVFIFFVIFFRVPFVTHVLSKWLTATPVCSIFWDSNLYLMYFSDLNWNSIFWGSILIYKCKKSLQFSTINRMRKIDSQTYPYFMH